jgi:hypothetical protein
VIGEDQRPSGAPGEAPRRRAEQERMVRVDDVERERRHEPLDAARIRHRQRELRIGRDRDRRVANDLDRGVLGPGQARAEDPRPVAGRFEASSGVSTEIVTPPQNGR